MAGCGALTMTSRSSRSGFMSAKAQATAPPQSCATSVNFFAPEMIGEGGEILHQKGHRVVLHVGRLGREVVAAHVGRHRVVVAAELGELPPPRVPELGKAVHEHDERAATFRRVVDALAVDVRVVMGGHGASSSVSFRQRR